MTLALPFTVGIDYDAIYSEGMYTMAGKNLVRQGEKRREDIIKFIRAFSAKNGYAPTFTEIGEAVGIASPNAVRNHLDKLREEGRIEMTPRIARSIVLTK